MDLNLIGLFVEIVESRSLSAAARKLGMTRSNISQRLKLLERETGAQLLRRSTRNLELDVSRTHAVRLRPADARGSGYGARIDRQPWADTARPGADQRIAMSVDWLFS